MASTKYGGTGLGLAICKEIIDAHEGKIRAHNNKDGKGVHFHSPFLYGSTNNLWKSDILLHIDLVRIKIYIGTVNTHQNSDVGFFLY